MLTELALPAFLDTSAGDLIADFFVPALTQSIRYDRGVGYFSSGWLRIAAEGMLQFAANGGHARWVTSPILDAADWEALQTGDAARTDHELRAILDRQVSNLASTLERDTLAALAWMVADNILDFKIALPRNKLERGDFHDKFGIFTDLGRNQVSFNGSYNDSIQGTRNYESIKVFVSWEAPYASLVHADAERFECLWNNFDPNVRVFDLPEAARAEILRLRTTERPYPEPEWAKAGQLNQGSLEYRSLRPKVPYDLVLRPYQIEAIEAWFDHDCRGLLEMATGTGKTITALAGSARLFEREQRLAVVIAVPYQHLVDQWSDEACAFGYRPVLAYQSKTRWLDELNGQIMEFNRGYRHFISTMTTHSTFSTPEFQASIARLSGPALLIADEAHHLGAEEARQNYPQTTREANL